jgi:uncharacterized protein YndB with AHSA1/START domain
MTRAFNAPKHLVYRCWTEPELVRRWLGPRSTPMVVCEMDVRIGGYYRWTWSMPDGGEMGMGGQYIELVPDERIVNTERFDESWYGGEALDTLTLTERDGVTTCTLVALAETTEAREAMMNSGMESGVAEGYDRMDEVLATL